MPHDQGAGLGHQQHREFLAVCAFLQGSSEELSIPTVQPGCAENVGLPILNADSKWCIRQLLKLWSEGKAVICSNINLYYVV